MASTSSLPLLHVWTKGNVFLRFRGTNTRKSLTSHLYHALCQNQIDACIAYKLDGGDRPSLSSWKWLKSHIFRSSFSPKIMQILYFLCLRELTKIVECMENKWQMVLPVFYKTVPGHVQDLTGSYGDALCKHERQCACYDEISLVLVAYFTCCLACLCSWFIMHCMQGWDQAN